MHLNKSSVYHFGTVSEEQLKNIPNDIQLDGEYPLDIEIFRTGKFLHPWYGDLVFDKAYLEKIVENYNKSCHPTDVSFDIGHDPDKAGAIAWVRKDVDEPLMVVSKMKKDAFGNDMEYFALIAKVNLNSEGAKLIKGKRYKFFSSEIHPNYKSYELFSKTVVDEEGNAKEVDYQMSEVGPVLLSGGITNRPFIIGMEPMSMSDSGNEKSMMFAFPQPDEEKQEKTNEPKEPVAPKVEEIPQGEQKMKLSDVKLDGATVSAKIQILKLSIPEIDESDVLMANTILAALEAQLQSEEALSLSVMKEQKAAKREQELAETLKQKEVSLQEYKETSYQKSVQLYCEDLRKKSFPEATISYLENKFSNMVPTSREQKFSTLNGEKVEQFDVMAFAVELLETMPAQAKVHEESITDTSGNVVETVPEQPAQKLSTDSKYHEGHQLFAKKHGIELSELDSSLEMIDKKGNLTTGLKSN